MARFKERLMERRAARKARRDERRVRLATDARSEVAEARRTVRDRISADNPSSGVGG